MDGFPPQALSATAWACGKHGCSLRLYDSIAAAAPLRISEFSPQGLANTAWGFATAGVAAPPLFEAIAAAAPARMARDEFDAQGYANTAWAFATAGYTSSSTGGVSPSSPLFDAGLRVLHRCKVLPTSCLLRPPAHFFTSCCLPTSC